ncbi:MAG: hypothetical protein MR662_01765 [Treponema porcinum]|uniref:hypothetical protein n=2 Tax=Treponema porcinum TaxID=261392 RepID=UPI002353FC83|nr:hypothetical protein [Treponema porcinum]MCI6179209.1 hypothetical protein [Treponema porcinum]
MKKTIYFISLAMAALFVSCSGTTDDASISFSVPREIVSSVFKSSDSSAQSDYAVKKIKCTLLDKNEKEIDSQTDDIAENTNTVITFSGIPAGTKVSASATIYGSDNENSPEYSLYTGQSGKITVKPGNNTITLKLKKTTTTVVLYNNTSATATPALSYATLTDDSVSSPKELLAKDSESSPIIVDYCFDNSNNLYAIVNNTAETGSSYSINKYKYNNGYNNKSDVTTYTIGETVDVATIDYIEASSDDKLYAVIDSMYIAQLILTDPTTEANNGTVSFNAYTLPTDWSNIKTFCTDGTNFYVIVSITSYDDMQSEIQTVKLVSCTVSGENQLTENKSILLASTATVEGDTPVFSVPEYNDALEYKDLCYINGKLYLLVSDVMKEGYNNTTSYSRGALCTFTVGDNGEIASDKIGIGYQKTPSYFLYTGSYDQATVSYPTITRTAYIGDVDSKLFYGPVKFVARKQDELIIADDGFSMVSEEYTDHQGHTQATVSSKNSVVTYNLNTESLNFVSLNGEYFEEKYSGYFYSSGFYATNQ